MEFAGIMLLSAALSIDAFNVGASCGFNSVRIPVCARLIILLISTVITSVSVFAGSLLCYVISETGAKCIGAALLCMLGIYMGAGSLRGERKAKGKKAAGSIVARSAEIIADVSSCDADSSRRIERGEAAVIGLALSADAFAAGLSSGMSGALSALMPVFCGVFQMMFLFIGEGFAKRLSLCTRVKASVFGISAGIVMVIMGLLRLVI